MDRGLIACCPLVPPVNLVSYCDSIRERSAVVMGGIPGYHRQSQGLDWKLLDWKLEDTGDGADLIIA